MTEWRKDNGMYQGGKTDRQVGKKTGTILKENKRN